MLARELTTVFSRLGGAGVRSIINSSPFPVMQRAYLDKALTDTEVSALVGFLQRADAEQAFLTLETLSIHIGDAGRLQSHLDAMFNAIESDQSFNPSQFHQAAQRLLDAL